MSEEGEFKKRIRSLYSIRKDENPEDYNRIREHYKIVEDAKKEFAIEMYAFQKWKVKFSSNRMAPDLQKALQRDIEILEGKIEKWFGSEQR